MNATTKQAILFLNDLGPDGNGRYVSDYLAFDDDDFEGCHNWVQWAFPTRTPSQFNPTAPIIDDDFVLDVLHEATHFVAKLNTAKLAALYMYHMGFEVFKSLRYVSIPTYRIEAPTMTAPLAWETPDNHNMLRFTRIIESLRLFGNDALAAEVYSALMQRVQTYTDRYSLSSVAYWSLVYTA